ncbi:hypothetical protein PR003_g17180 [Phytophthora rubi]|uniref:Transmembrane protein n=1 Tax=Phytophthora rubi TaxID=129364 RepID=A0A6A3KVH4_9STRA|nr:hypothetical protein PR001_g16467 [Phytophthora rubi]KAE9322642.1 hypothetical protein PR003_g17180 [Phytophthora rubi]
MSTQMNPGQSLGAMETVETVGKVELLRGLHRVVVFFVALWYVVISMKAFLASVTVLRGIELKDQGITVHESALIVAYAGESAINESPLVQTVLGGSTDLRDDTIYLVTNSSYSFTECTAVAGYDGVVYGNSFARFLFNSLHKYATDDLAYLTELELIAPVIDSTFDLLVSLDEAVTQLRMYFLVRQKSNTSETLLLSALFSTQDFQLDQQYQSGAALFATIAAIDDMRATEVTHGFAIARNYPYESEPHFSSCKLLGVDSDDNFWRLECFPSANSTDSVKEVCTAFRTGGFIKDPVAQSNIEIVLWNLPNDPASELRNWEWRVLADLHDSWAWTHSIHGFFALFILFDLGVLLFVVYQHFRIGHFWIGDAFATISSSLLYRGVLIFLSNHLNGYWTLTEFCLAVGSELGSHRPIHYRPELVHADLLTFFLNMTSVLSYLFRERIDPVLAFALFELSFAYRVEFVKSSPTLRDIIVDFADTNYWLGIVDVSPFLAQLSPMKFWTVHAIVSDRKLVVLSTVLCIFGSMIWLVVYLCLRKGYRYVKQKRTAADRRTNVYKAGTNGLTTDEGQLTSFETATGSALSRRYGVISGYDNYVVRDNKRYASVDAVYGNGYLVANQKFLVATEDMMSLLSMKISGVRFTNIYVYAILPNGGVNQTAQLVYPNTISWSDLGHLGVAKLA